MATTIHINFQKLRSMESPMELVVILIPVEQLRFAECCTGSGDISQAVSSGLDLLAERLMLMRGSNAASQNEDLGEMTRKH
jgi:hypothetical protein